MITIQTTTQQITAPDGTLATGTIQIQPHLPFEYDEGATRRHVSQATTTINIETGIITDGAGTPTTVSIAPTSGAGNDVANNYYDAVWQMNGAAMLTQRWAIDAAPAIVGLLDIPLVSTPSLPVITVGSSGAVVMNWRGTYNAGTTYAQDATVANAGRSFISLQAANIGHTPPATGSGDAWWALIADKGTNGTNGTNGTSVDHVARTIGNGAPGTTDTYTVWGDAGATVNLGTFLVYNGADGAGGGGSGDMTKAVYDPNNVGANAFDMASMVEAVNARILTDAERTNITTSTAHAASAHAPSGATVNSTDAALLARANHTGTQTLATISNSGTAAALNVPAAGDAAAGEVVKGSDTRLTDNRAPTPHTHSAVDTVDFDAAVANNATVSANTAKVSADGLVNTHSDVNVAAPANGQTLTYNNTTGQWENQTPASGVTDHTLLTNIGTNTHTQIDTHVATPHAPADATNGATIAQAAAIALNTAKVGITPTQANDITTNNSKVGITAQQAADIATNNAKVSDINHVAALLPNVDNTADANKPVSTLQQTALNLKEDGLGTPAADGYVLSSTIAGVRAWVAQAIGAALNVAQSFTAAQRVTPVALTDAATVAMDASLSNFYTLILAGNRTLGLPTNLVAGQSGSIKIAQDVTGTRTLAFNAVWKFVGGTAPTLTTTASAVDRLDYYVVSATEIHAAIAADVK